MSITDFWMLSERGFLMKVSPINFKSGIIRLGYQSFNPDTIKSYEPEIYGFRTMVNFTDGDKKYLKVRTDIFEKAMLKAKNSDEIVDITDFEGKVFSDD